ncbi:MAG: hypothetical protein ACK49X_03135 [Akkermansiaceae bacterium]
MAALACIFQLVRVLSSILFALMTLVLPMAGVQRYVCTVDMEFSGNIDDCPMTGDDCGGEDSELPDCMVTTDLVPDAEPPNLWQIPFLRADEVIYLRLSVADLRGIDAAPARSEYRRGPPDSREWYVKQQRLLI